MPKNNPVPQDYPRISEETNAYYGLLDDSKLQQHTYKVPIEELKKIILRAIENANKKSSRVILDIPDSLSEGEVQKKYEEEGKELFKYFRQYYGDPASTAHECLHKHYVEVGKEQFRNKTLQRQRMNSGWRYQFIAKDVATNSRRFISVSDMGAKEADFNAQIGLIDTSKAPVNIYVSIKNRSNTMGGQDWPKAIYALEDVARFDKNRGGPYLCVFGITIQKGKRYTKVENATNRPYSVNTEIWLSDYFWPFFSNYSYQEIVQIVLEVLLEASKPDKLDDVIPEELLKSFGASCANHHLVDVNGYFDDAQKLVNFFVGQ